MKTAFLLTLLPVCPALSLQEDIFVDASSDEARVATESATETIREKEWTPRLRVQLLLTPNVAARADVVEQLVSVTRLVPHDTAASRRISGETIGAAYRKVEELRETGALVRSPGSLDIHCDNVNVSMACSEDEDAVSLEVAGRARVSLPGIGTIECSSANLKDGKLVLKGAKFPGAAFKVSASELTLDVKPAGVKTTRFELDGCSVFREDPYSDNRRRQELLNLLIEADRHSVAKPEQ